MTDAMREARERVTEIAWAPGVRFMGEGARFAEGLDALLAARDAAWRKAVARVRMLHSASCLRWIRNDESQPCSCDDTTKIHNAALDALLAAMEAK